jgi:hypothetical protein
VLAAYLLIFITFTANKPKPDHNKQIATPAVASTHEYIRESEPEPYSPEPKVVPEPGTFVLLAVAAATAGLYFLRRKR